MGGEHALARPLKVATLNAWGLWLVSKRRTERMAALADYLRRPTCPADIVLLQEVWCGEDVAALRQAGAEGRLPHSAHFQGGALGPGLLLLSAFPVLETAFHPYSARGDPAALLQGDYLTGKGVGWAAVAAPCGRLSIFNTHLSANYAQRWQHGAAGLPPEIRLPRDGLAGVRLLQVLELAAFVRSRSAGVAGVVLGGDFNATPDTLEFSLLQALLPSLRDSWAVAQPLLLGATANALESSFTTVGAGHCPARIDYLLTSGQPLSAELALAETGRGFSFSDHLGVLATLRFGSESSLADDDEKDGAAGAADEAQQAPGSTGSGGATRSDGGSDGEWQEVGGRSTGARSPPQRQQQQQGQQQQLGTPGALAGTLELMRMRPAPFQHAASALEEAATEMAAGRRRFVRAAAGLWATGCGCTGALLFGPWWQQQCGGEPFGRAAYVALLGCMGAAFGWAGALFVGGFVCRGAEAAALRQAAAQLRLAQGNDVGAQTALYQAGDGGDSDRGGTTAAADGPCGLHKRGVGWGLTVAEIGALNGLTWYYNWGPHIGDNASAAAAAAAGLSFAPMQWGSWGIDQLAAQAQPGARVVLGVGALWPRLQAAADALGVRLGSPAAAPCGAECLEPDPFQWWDRFFALCKGCRVDFLATHLYSCNPTWLLAYLKQCRKYGLPIWLTEFACSNPGGPDAVSWRFMARVLPLLDGDPWVARYAWFALETSGWLGSSNSLMNVTTSTLTDMGRMPPAGGAAGSAAAGMLPGVRLLAGGFPGDAGLVGRSGAAAGAGASTTSAIFVS
ncbi:neutral sphingomyelinase [Micractinium conductrix]|uniref:Neutral sphingomyelinase n=1 Tax=Micractinium conductrix TaxID=554055 RepID=A0A2P6VP45_9CHLO|nr:neutral sphingomyelinase [Micractinium conductrix]|eukprot:PSC75873.1 neutral sphingomyelinase [Micractinium conductrix]